MLQLKNNSPFAAKISVFPNKDGIDTLYLIVKATFNIGMEFTLPDEQIEPTEEDEYFGEPELSSIRSCSDFHTGKLSSDILVLGDAVAAGGRQVAKMEVGVKVGHVQKTLSVFGDRRWEGGRMTQPLAFSRMPIVYERAFGGVDVKDEVVRGAESRNPVGLGFAGKRSARDMDGCLLPNIENPSHLLQYHDDCPEPAGFGALSPSWMPRRQYAGTYDEAWQSQRAPFLPLDFDPRFNNVAPSDLIYPGFLQGGERVEMLGLHEAGKLAFSLPRVNLSCKVQVGKNTVTPDVNLETLILRPNDMQLSLVWRSQVNCDKQLSKVREVQLAMAR